MVTRKDKANFPERKEGELLTPTLNFHISNDWIARQLKAHKLNTSFLPRYSHEFAAEIKKLTENFLDPKNWLLLEHLMTFLLEGEIVFNTFLEINWSVDHHLFFLDYYKMLNFYTVFLCTETEYLIDRSEAFLHAWDRGCSTIGFSQRLYKKKNVPKFKLTEGLGNFSKKKNFFYSKSLIKRRIKNFKEVSLNPKLNFILGGRVGFYNTLLKIDYINCFNPLDTFYIDQERYLLEKFNFWFILHISVMMTTKTFRSFFWELKDYVEVFLLNFTSNFNIFETEIVNSAETLFEDEEHRKHITWYMRILLEERLSLMAKKTPKPAFDTMSPFTDMYYLLIKGTEVDNFLGFLKWDLEKLILFSNHLAVLDLILHNIFQKNLLSFCVEKNSIWSDFIKFFFSEEIKVTKEIHRRWSSWMKIYNTVYDFNCFIKEKKWVVEQIQSFSSGRFFISLWTVQERKLFFNKRWRTLHKLILDSSDKYDYSFLIYSLEIIELFFGWLDWAEYEDLIPLNNETYIIGLRYLVYNRKFLNKLIIRHEKHVFSSEFYSKCFNKIIPVFIKIILKKIKFKIYPPAFFAYIVGKHFLDRIVKKSFKSQKVQIVFDKDFFFKQVK